jgi:hypothetical protein
MFVSNIHGSGSILCCVAVVSSGCVVTARVDRRNFGIRVAATQVVYLCINCYFFLFSFRWAVVPIILVLACQSFWRAVGKCQLNDIDKQKLHTSTVAVLYLIWPSLCSQTFGAFACKSVCDNGSFLRAAIDEPCWELRHWMYVGFIGIPMMIVYIFGLPLAAYIATRKLQLRAKHRHVEPSTLKGVSLFLYCKDLCMYVCMCDS